MTVKVSLSAQGASMRPLRNRSFVAAMLVALVACASIGIAVTRRAEAITANVFVGQDASANPARKFTPPIVTIAVNDDVYWLWNSYGETHVLASYDESTPGFPDWGSAGPGFDYTFTAPGVYTYYCSIHSSRAAADPSVIDANIAAGAMVGKVIVQAPATETPTVTNTPTVTATPTITPTPTNTSVPQQVGGIADVDVRRDEPPASGASGGDGSALRALLLTIAIAAGISLVTAAGFVAIRQRR